MYSFILLKFLFSHQFIDCPLSLTLFQKEKAVEEEPEVDPDIAAMMGFGGFGSSKK